MKSDNLRSAEQVAASWDEEGAGMADVQFGSECVVALTSSPFGLFALTSRGRIFEGRPANDINRGPGFPRQPLQWTELSTDFLR